MSALLLTSALSAYSQIQYEYGMPDDLKGLTKYYVDTSGDIKARNDIVKEVSKALPQLQLMDDIETSQIRLSFMGSVQDVVGNARTVGNSTYVDNERLPIGTGLVWIDPRGADKSKLRVVLNFASRQDSKLEKMPYTKFAKEFIKTYKKANGLK